jgi:AraC-like DNA-binding protein
VRPESSLLLPPSDLSACLFAAVVRDTRQLALNDRDRFNFFPASPLFSITQIIDGEIRFAPQCGGLDAARVSPPQARTFATPPQDSPTVSWCSGPVLAISVGVYPDSWARVSAACDLMALFADAFQTDNDVNAGWNRFCASLSPIWDAVRGTAILQPPGASKLSDWSRALLVRAAMTGPGKSVRSIERRLKRWSGQSRRSLEFYAGMEDLHRLSSKAKDRSLAELALEAGFSDQSHMGRAVRRATGFSPDQLNRAVKTEQAFWYYRLSGEQF